MLRKPHIAPPYYPDPKHGDPHFSAAQLRAYYQVRDFTCGFASTLTVLHGFKRYVEPAELYRRLGTNSTGTRQSAIIRELRASGVSARPRYDLGFDELARLVDQRALVIAYHHRLEHWLVLYGVGREPARVLVADPLPGHRHEHTWAEFGPKLGGFGIVCRPGLAARRSPPRPTALAAPRPADRIAG